MKIYSLFIYLYSV